MNREEMQKGQWILASISGGAHLERTVEMYKELGLDVYLEEVDPGECRECRVCYEAGNEAMYRIYTRAKDEEIP
jgi:hypothetical protein